MLGALRDEKVDLADEVLRARPYAADYDPIDLVRRACAEYDDPAGEAARTFARESRRAGDATSEAILARDASAAMRMLAAALRTGR